MKRNQVLLDGFLFVGFVGQEQHRLLQIILFEFHFLNIILEKAVIAINIFVIKHTTSRG